MAFASYAPAHLARGISIGTGRFHAYAVVMGADGVVRIILCVALAVVGVTPPAPTAWPSQCRRCRRRLRRSSRSCAPTGPPAEWGEVTPNLGWLLLGSVCAADLVNAGPVAANLLAAPSEEALVTPFGYGVLLSRIPLFLFQAVQAALLRVSAWPAARGDRRVPRRASAS